MHRPDPSGEVAPPVSEVKNSEKQKPQTKIPETEKPVPEKQKAGRTEQVKPVALEKAESNGRRKSALSLSSLKRNKQEAEEIRKKKAVQNNSENLPRDPFTEEAFHQVWQDYIDGLIEGGEKILASILMADKPVLKDQMILVTYPNQLMKKELLRVRPKVLKHIRSALNNYSVDFEIEVKEENQKRFAYTPQEKYELLKEKNSEISFLRKTFNLEL